MDRRTIGRRRKEIRYLFPLFRTEDATIDQAKDAIQIIYESVTELSRAFKIGVVDEDEDNRVEELTRYTYAATLVPMARLIEKHWAPFQKESRARRTRK